MGPLSSVGRWLASVVSTLVGMALVGVGVMMAGYTAVSPLFVVDPPLSLGATGLVSVLAGSLVLRYVVATDDATDDTGARETGDATAAYQFDGL